MFVLAIIPARAGSKGIPNKNTYLLNGKPLIEYTIDEVRCSRVSDYYISTDSDIIFERYNKVIRRPSELAQDDTPMIPVIQDAILTYESFFDFYIDAVMLLQPTSPLRTYDDINKALILYKNKKCPTSLYSGYKMGIKHKNKIYDKHTIAPHFQRNGAIFIAKRELIFNDRLWDDDVIEFEMPKSRSIDIDDMEDMYMAESILKNPKEVIV